MTTLTALQFATSDGAEQMLGRLEQLQKQQLITIQDAAIVSWPAGKKKPKTRQLHNMAGFGALQGAFWGMLFGLLFFVPILGLAVGAGMGALTGSFADVGIDDKFIKEVSAGVRPGTSALFLMTTGGDAEKLLPEIREHKARLLSSTLPPEQEQALREALEKHK